MAFFRKRVYASGPALYARPMKRAKFSKSRTSSVRRINRRTAPGPRTRGSLRTQVKSLQTVVKKLAPEVKSLDVSLTSANITSSGVAVHMTPIAQGDALEQREGNSVCVNSVSVRGVFTQQTDAPTTGAARILVVVDRQQIADTTPSPSDVITDAIIGGANPVINYPNRAFLERFRILFMSKIFDFKRLVLDSDIATVPTQSPYIEWDWTGALKVLFNGTASTDIQKNGIYFIILTDSTSNTLDFSGVARIRYTDV